MSVSSLFMSSLLCDVFRVAWERVRERLDLDETKRDAEHQTRHTHILEFEAKINAYFSTIKQRKWNRSILIFGVADPMSGTPLWLRHWAAVVYS